jgi:hypothetical protein
MSRVSAAAAAAAATTTQEAPTSKDKAKGTDEIEALANGEAQKEWSIPLAHAISYHWAMVVEALCPPEVLREMTFRMWWGHAHTA